MGLRSFIRRQLLSAVEVAEPRPRTPAKGSRTDNQGKLDVYGFPFSYPGFSRIWSGVYTTYRLMLAVPPLALVRAATKATMKSAEWSVEVDDEGPSDAADYLQNIFVDRKAELLNDMVRAIDYGNQPFEKVWANEGGFWTIKRLKPLLPDLTDYKVNDAGDIVGLRNGAAELDAGKCFVVTYDAEAGNVYGRSRCENLRNTAFRAWTDTLEKFGKYTTRVSGAQPVVWYPPGQVRDKDGNLKDSQEVARDVASKLAQSSGICIPTIYSEDAKGLAMDNSKLAELLAWRLEMFEGKTDHAKAFLESLAAFESWFCMGWLWPPRSMLEGQFGTKAEAGTHQDLGVTIAEQDLADMLTQLNRQCVDDVLVTNWGEEARGTARIKAAPLNDEAIAMQREIVKALMTNAANIDILAAMTDLDAMIDNAGVPKAKQTVEIDDVLEERKAAAEEADAEEPAEAMLDRLAVGMNGHGRV